MFSNRKFRLCILVLIMVAAIFSGCDQENSSEPEQTATHTQMPATDPTETEVPATKNFSEKPGEQDGFVHSHPLGTTVRYDLNGDGVGEDITVRAQEYADGKLTVGGVELTYNAITPTGYFTVLNVDRQSDALLIGISDYGFSDDPATVLYAYDGEKIAEVGYYEDITGKNAWNTSGAVCHGDGTISAKIRFDILGTWEAQALYRVESGKLKDITDVYYYHTWEEQPGGWEVTAKAELIMYGDIWDSETQVIIPVGTKLAMTGLKEGGIAGTYWVCFEAESQAGTLWMAAEVVGWYTNVAAADGFIRSEDAFDGFFYAG